MGVKRPISSSGRVDDNGFEDLNAALMSIESFPAKTSEQNGRGSIHVHQFRNIDASNQSFSFADAFLSYLAGRIISVRGDFVPVDDHLSAFTEKRSIRAEVNIDSE